jgi:hypothetical protein
MRLMGLIPMSERDLHRIEVPLKVKSGRMAMVSAPHVLDLSKRYFHRPAISTA